MKSWLLIGGSILALVLMLAGAAFVAGQLLIAGQPTGNAGSLVVSGESGETEFVEFALKSAPELPEAPAAAFGSFVRREGNSLFIGRKQRTGVVTGEEQDGYETIVEVVVTHDTQVYRDVTFETQDAPSSGEVQQVVKPGSLDEIGKTSYVAVWGERHGDRVVAQVLVYMVPPTFSSPSR